MYTARTRRLTESVFKRIFANSNPKALKHFRENEMTSIFGQVSRYHCINMTCCFPVIRF